MSKIYFLKFFVFIFLFFCFSLDLYSNDYNDANNTGTKQRLIILADMGNEPDEEQQIVHMLMYNNMFEIEGLIAVTGKWLKSGPRDYLFHNLIDAYALVEDNLALHADGWHTAEYLRSVTANGQYNYGMAAVGPGKSSDGSRLIEAALIKDDPRPVYIVVNAGANTLAQALEDLSANLSTTEMDRITEKIIAYENGSQDNAGAWLAGKYPKIAWHRSNHQTNAFGSAPNALDLGGPYTWEPHARTTYGQEAWAAEHVRNGHGPLGAKYPSRHDGSWSLEGGGTSPWIGLANHGLFSAQNMHWGGWGGRFSKKRLENVFSRYYDIRVDEESYDPFSMFIAEDVTEIWTDPVHGDSFKGYMVPIWRFRRAMWNDFRARMDWCIKPFNEVNHNPIATVNGDTADTIIFMEAHAGESIVFDAAASKDPDGDGLDTRWFFYPEAGTYSGNLTIANPSVTNVTFSVPVDASDTQIHLILEVKDKSSIIPMYDYRRIVINIVPD